MIEQASCSFSAHSERGAGSSERADLSFCRLRPSPKGRGDSPTDVTGSAQHDSRRHRRRLSGSLRTEGKTEEKKKGFPSCRHSRLAGWLADGQ